MKEFSGHTRIQAIERFKSETFDFLVIGGGITGAAVARDAASRGMKVALVEKKDFAHGTSSSSSKLIHGGLRYLENFELKLVFEALSERTLLLKTAPHLVRPLPFYFPVYEKDAKPRWMISLGLWLYDLLSLGRSPGWHQRLNTTELKEALPYLNTEKLKGGFRYYDAWMWDDALAIEVLRAANTEGAVVANYCEALYPLWSQGEYVNGYRVRDQESGEQFDIRASRTVLCGGPWTDELGKKLSLGWKPWLRPSKGLHLVFSSERLPVAGAMVMAHPEDGRIAFVIPRSDLGAGVTIVGTTDSLSNDSPDAIQTEATDIDYLLRLLERYFPDAKLTAGDIVSTYVGLRPLMNPEVEKTSNVKGGQPTLQKISREHHIDVGPGGTVFVAGGKYTTHRTMAKEIVDFTLEHWQKDASSAKVHTFPNKIGKSLTEKPLNSLVSVASIEKSFQRFRSEFPEVSETDARLLSQRYGMEIFEFEKEIRTELDTYDENKRGFPGFPLLRVQLIYAIKRGMCMHLEDFYFRRVPLFLARFDHGLTWSEDLAQVWAHYRHQSDEQKKLELVRLHAEIERRALSLTKPTKERD